MMSSLGRTWRSLYKNYPGPCYLFILLAVVVFILFYPTHPFPKIGENVRAVPEKRMLETVGKIPEERARIEEEYNTTLPPLEDGAVVRFYSGNRFYDLMKVFLWSGYLIVCDQDGNILYITPGHR